MSTLIVEVCELLEVKPHTNAEKLEIGIVKGWQTVLGKSQFVAGEKVVYFPPDACIPVALSDKLGITKYLGSNGRVKACRLRGEPSFGAVAKLSELDSFLGTPQVWVLGEDVKDKLGIIKYEPPISSNEGDACAENNLFHRYTSIENIKNYPNVFQVGEQVYITEKIHGCFTYNSKVTMADGRQEFIGKLVNQRVKDKVLSFNELTGEIEHKDIINWHNNGNTINWMRIRIQYTDRGSRYSQIICTPNHNIFVNNKWIPAHEIKIGDKVKKISIKFNPVQEQLILGSTLGDGYIRRDAKRLKSNPLFEVGHVSSKVEYLNLKSKILGKLVITDNVNKTSGYGSHIIGLRTHAMPCLMPIHNSFYPNFPGGKKIIPVDLFKKLNSIGLAFWYMDDGSQVKNHRRKFHHSVHLATNGFDDNYNEIACEILNNKFGFAAKCQEADVGKRIEIDAETSQNFFMQISPFVPNCMKYKIPEEYHGNCFWDTFSFDDNHQGLIDAEVVDIIHDVPDYLKDRDNTWQTRYDLTIEGNSNYFVNNFLVHNSNCRMGIVKNLDDTLEFCAGSHRVQRKENFDSRYWKHFTDGTKKLVSYLQEKYQAKSVIVFGEIFGFNKGMTYQVPAGQTRFRAFDIAVDGKYLNFDEKDELFRHFDIEIVPILYVGPYDSSLIEKYTYGETTLGSDNRFKGREGIVIGTVVESHDHKFGRKIFKSISADYLERNDIGDCH